MTSPKLPPSSHLIYVVMQKRGDGHVYPDMHKTSGKFFHTPEDAQRELLACPEWLRPSLHIVPMVITTEAYWNELFKEDWI